MRGNEKEELKSGEEISEHRRMKDILELDIAENGNNLSAGERQLVCICRAVLRKNKVVVMDEATASIDLATEEII